MDSLQNGRLRNSSQMEMPGRVAASFTRRRRGKRVRSLVGCASPGDPGQRPLPTPAGGTHAEILYFYPRRAAGRKASTFNSNTIPSPPPTWSCCARCWYACDPSIFGVPYRLVYAAVTHTRTCRPSERRPPVFFLPQLGPPPPPLSLVSFKVFQTPLFARPVT